jgi:8-oxo-dGTP pyrophosphatase MutT (NUDIX family)
VAESLRRLRRPHGDHGRTRTGTVACVHDLDVIPRRAARVLLVDARNRVLLLHGFNPSAPAELFWFTIGGGIDPGESAAAAAARELLEEAGLAVDPADLGEPVWHRIAEFSFDGRHYRQEEDYFLLRVESFEVSLASLDTIEQETVVGYRWWEVAGLQTAREAFFPGELPRLLRELTS